MGVVAVQKFQFIPWFVFFSRSIRKYIFRNRSFIDCILSLCRRERSREMLVYGKVLVKMLDAMTVINPHLEGKTRTGTLPLTTEVHLHINSPYNISA